MLGKGTIDTLSNCSGHLAHQSDGQGSEHTALLQ